MQSDDSGDIWVETKQDLAIRSYHEAPTTYKEFGHSSGVTQEPLADPFVESRQKFRKTTTAVAIDS